MPETEKAAGGGGGGANGGGALTQAEVTYLAEKVSFLDKSLDRMQKLGDAVESRMGGAISSAGFGRSAKKFQDAVRKATMGTMQAWSQLYIFVIVLRLLFILHQARLLPPCPHRTPTSQAYTRVRFFSAVHLGRRGSGHCL